ncbi:MAG TPA: response regulator transcription factor [Bacteroidia bacterium]|jgi:DNA-binding NarL/FixJ family response regulator|nr:response regulator transcription factor [Bacteroidia bacterium]
MMKPKLIIADDHRLFSAGLNEIIIRELPVEIVATASTGKETIELCLKYKPDIVIMDINMPDVNGIYACKEIKRIRPDTKIFFVTMLSALETLSEALRAGADAYILKGNGIDDVVEAFHAAVKDECYISKELRHLVNLTDKNSFANESLISPREKDILKLICEGHTNEKIAETLSISVRTVDTHRTNMLNKLKLPNTAALVRFAVENKLI